MASYRVAQVLKTRGQFSDEEIARMSEDEAWQWIHSSTPSTVSRSKNKTDAEKKNCH